MSIKVEDVIHVPTWNSQRVEEWMRKRKIPQAITAIFCTQYKIDGPKLLDIASEEVRELCRGANATKKDEFVLMDSIKMLQRQYYDVQRGYKRDPNKNPRKRRRTNNRTAAYHTTNARNYRKHWTETQLQRAWKLWLKYENLKTVASKIGRTHIATLTKMNLIRRSALESNNPEYEANITDRDKVHHYDLTKIVKEQKEKEDKQHQWARMKETGVNIEFEEFGEMSTDEDYDESEDNDDEEKHAFNEHRNRNRKAFTKRKRGNMSLSEDESENDDEPIISRLNRGNNHNHNRLKRRFMDEDEDEDEDESESVDEEEIKKQQEELWENDRWVTIEEREKLADKGIYVVEALRNHKKDDEDEEWQFYVKWLDYDSDENTWEPESNIPEYMVKNYWERRRKARNSNKQKQRERQREREIRRQNMNMLNPNKKKRRVIEELDDSDVEIMQ